MGLTVRYITAMLDPYRIPPAHDGLSIGLYGGTFDPPHQGHCHVAKTALKRLGLDYIWWLVTPGNPLKDHAGLPSLPDRLNAAQSLAGSDRRMVITALEGGFKRPFTAASVSYLKARCPRTRFVWIMGADNLADFHRWHAWQSILETLPIAIIDRPGMSYAPLSSQAAQRYHRSRRPESSAPMLAHQKAPAWTFLHGHKVPMSSTEIRALRSQ